MASWHRSTREASSSVEELEREDLSGIKTITEEVGEDKMVGSQRAGTLELRKQLDHLQLLLKMLLTYVYSWYYCCGLFFFFIILIFIFFQNMQIMSGYFYYFITLFPLFLFFFS